MDRDNNLNQNDLDFEKINATLADPSFANWYYHQVIDIEWYENLYNG